MQSREFHAYRRILRSRDVWSAKEVANVFGVSTDDIVDAIYRGEIVAERKVIDGQPNGWTLRSADLVQNLLDSERLREHFLPSDESEGLSFRTSKLLERVKKDPPGEADDSLTDFTEDLRNVISKARNPES